MLLYDDPLEILNKLPDAAKPEMTTWQSKYLCGLIKEYKPNKILEVGVAAGGTTAILLNCISELGLDCKIYSTDLSKAYYKDPKFNTGFLAEYAKEHLRNSVDHCFLFGYIPELIDTIGNDIDFLVLDTVHTLPGEIFDFLVCLPYLSDDAVVVVHDVAMNHIVDSSFYSYATQVLLDTAVGEKMPVFGVDNEFGFPNIAAFRINSDTKKYIFDVFGALSLTWHYLPEQNEIDLYRRKLLELGYSHDCIKMFDIAAEMNKSSFFRINNKRVSDAKAIYEFVNTYKGKNIYLYGAGDIGQKVFKLLQPHCNILGYIVSDDQVLPADNNIHHLSEVINNIGDTDILISTGIRLQKEIKSSLSQKGVLANNIHSVDETICNYFLGF